MVDYFNIYNFQNKYTNKCSTTSHTPYFNFDAKTWNSPGILLSRRWIFLNSVCCGYEWRGGDKMIQRKVARSPRVTSLAKKRGQKKAKCLGQVRYDNVFRNNTKAIQRQKSLEFNHKLMNLRHAKLHRVPPASCRIVFGD